MKKILSLLILFTVMLSCSNESDLLDDQLRQPQEDLKIRTQEEAIEMLYDFMNDLNNKSEDQLKSKTLSLKIKDVKAIPTYSYSKSQHKNKVKSLNENIDIPIYEFKLESEDGQEGFAIILGDARFEEVVAYSPKGSISDTLYNEALAVFLSGVSDYAELLSGEYRQDYEDWMSNYISGTEKYIRTIYTQSELSSVLQNPYGDWDFREYQTRFIPVKWNQTAPYNNNVPVVCDGFRAKAGCAPVAIAQIMSYFRRPYGYDWNNLNISKTVKTIGEGESQYRINEVARLMVDIGVESKTNYRCTGSGTTTMNTRSTLSKYGYSYDYVHLNYATMPNGTTILNSLTGGSPVIIAAKELYTEKYHMWIVDGILRKERGSYYANTFIDAKTNVVYYELWSQRQRFTQVHCNWGWGGSSDGWYSHRLLTPINEIYKFYTEFELIYNLKFQE